MPQLDLMTFFTQFFWFSLNFIFFYLFFLHYILPFVITNLKFRKKTLEFLANDINKKKENVSDIFNTYDNILYKLLNYCRIYINKLMIFSNSWIVSNIFKTIINYFILANNKFLKAIVEKNFSLNILNKKFKKSINNVNWSKLWNKNKKISKI